MDGNLTSNYATYLGNIMRHLKRMAIDYKLIICVLAHVNRTYSDRDELNSISDSSKIAQESDFVLFIDRKDDSLQSEIKIKKNRRTGMLKKIKVEMQKGKLVEIWPNRNQTN